MTQFIWDTGCWIRTRPKHRKELLADQELVGKELGGGWLHPSGARSGHVRDWQDHGHSRLCCRVRTHRCNSHHRGDNTHYRGYDSDDDDDNEDYEKVIMKTRIVMRRVIRFTDVSRLHVTMSTPTVLTSPRPPATSQTSPPSVPGAVACVLVRRRRREGGGGGGRDDYERQYGKCHWSPVCGGTSSYTSLLLCQTYIPTYLVVCVWQTYHHDLPVLTCHDFVGWWFEQWMVCNLWAWDPLASLVSGASSLRVKTYMPSTQPSSITQAHIFL